MVEICYFSVETKRHLRRHCLHIPGRPGWKWCLFFEVPGS